MRTYLALILAGCLSLAAHADSLRNSAVGGQVADVASTAIALSVPGVVEMNPLGLAVLPLKVAAFVWAEGQPPEVAVEAHRGLSAFGWGAAASNLCTASVAASGGSTALPCLLIGIAVGSWDWGRTEGTEREQFDRLCAYNQRRSPGFQCFWTEPARAE